MAFGKKAKIVDEPPSSSSTMGGDTEDPTAWILNNEFANFVLMNTNEIVSRPTDFVDYPYPYPYP